MNSHRVISVKKNRSATEITFSVWRALFMREAVYRLSTGRAAWLWLLLEPVYAVAFLGLFFSTLHLQTMGEMNLSEYIILGLVGYYMYRQPGMQGMNAIDANKPLFSYRQVKPVDTVLMRAVLEGVLMIVVTIILCSGAELVGLNMIPADPLLVFAAFFGLWMLGLGFGLVTSVIQELIPELGKFIVMTTIPLHLFSGVMIPVTTVPEPYYDWLMFNPIIHGIEYVRMGFSQDYRAIPGLSFSYLYSFGFVSAFLGLALHKKFEKRLASI